MMQWLAHWTTEFHWEKEMLLVQLRLRNFLNIVCLSTQV